MKAEIAKRIRMARLAKGLSQQNVADELHLSGTAFSNIERGITNLTMTRLQQIATILEKDVDELLGFHKNQMVNEPSLVHQNNMAQQVLLLSNQLNAVQFKLGQLENDFRTLEAKVNGKS